MGITISVFGFLIFFIFPSLLTDVLPNNLQSDPGANLILGGGIQAIFSSQNMQIFGGVMIIAGIGSSVLSVSPSLNKKQEDIELNQETRHRKEMMREIPNRFISSLDVNILKLISTGSNTLDSLVMILRVDKSIVANKLTDLYVRGYISENKFLTQKGFEYLNNFQ